MPTSDNLTLLLFGRSTGSILPLKITAGIRIEFCGPQDGRFTLGRTLDAARMRKALEASVTCRCTRPPRRRRAALARSSDR